MLFARSVEPPSRECLACRRTPWKTRAFRTRNGRDLKFSAIGFGSAPIGELYELHRREAAIATVEQAFASGIRVFDSSPHYGNGIAESRLGAGLRRAPRSDFLLSTKIGRVMDPFAKPAPRNKDVYSPGFVGGYAHAPHFDYRTTARCVPSSSPCCAWA